MHRPALCLSALCIVAALLVTACQEQPDVAATVQAILQQAPPTPTATPAPDIAATARAEIARAPTVTPQPAATPQPTATPQATVTPQPTATPIILPPTPTALPLFLFQPTAIAVPTRIPTPVVASPSGPATPTTVSLQIGGGLTLTQDPIQPVTGRPLRFTLTGLSPWQRFTVAFLNPQGALADWTSESESFVNDSQGQRIKTQTLYGDEAGRTTWARLHSLDVEGQWTVRVVLDNQVYTSRYTVQPLQLSTTVFNDLAVSLRRYSATSSDVYLSGGVPLSVALDYGGYLFTLAGALAPYLGVTTTQIPNAYFFSTTGLMRTAAQAGAISLGGGEVGFQVSTGRYRGIFVSMDPFTSVTTQVFIHEYTHLLVQERAGAATVPAWFNEGIAGYFEVALAPNYGATLTARRVLFTQADKVRSAPSAGTLVPLSRLTSQRDWNEEPNETLTALHYAQAQMAIRYLVERFGNPAPGLVLRQLALGASFQQAFATVTGISVDAFERDWLVWASQWQDAARERIRQYTSQVRALINTASGIQGDRNAFLASAAGTGQFAGRVATQQQFVTRTTTLLTQASALSAPPGAETLQANLTAYITKMRVWLQTELNAFTDSNTGLIEQANAMIPEINARESAIAGQRNTLDFEWVTGS